jgi:hypothetical protein
MEQHHCPPKSRGGKNGKTISMCPTCHDVIHFLIKIEDIEKYNTIQKIKELPILKKYLDWAITKKNNVVYKLKKILKFIQ